LELVVVLEFQTVDEAIPIAVVVYQGEQRLPIQSRQDCWSKTLTERDGLWGQMRGQLTTLPARCLRIVPIVIGD
jgi:hypothetical protein